MAIPSTGEERSPAKGEVPRQAIIRDGRLPTTSERQRVAVPFMLPCNLTQSEFAHLLNSHMEDLTVIDINSITKISEYVTSKGHDDSFANFWDRLLRG